MSEPVGVEPGSVPDELVVGPELVDVAAAVRLTGLPRTALYELVARSEIPHVRIGVRLWFRPGSLREWVAGLEVPARRQQDPVDRHGLELVGRRRRGRAAAGAVGV